MSDIDSDEQKSNAALIAETAKQLRAFLVVHELSLKKGHFDQYVLDLVELVHEHFDDEQMDCSAELVDNLDYDPKRDDKDGDSEEPNDADDCDE